MSNKGSWKFSGGHMLSPMMSFGTKGKLFSKASQAGHDYSFVKKLSRIFQYWPEVLVFTLAVTATVVCFWLLRASEHRSADNIVVQQASDRATVLAWEMSRVLGDLQTVTAFMSISLDWREDYFREKFKNLTAGILDRSPGTQGLTWVPMVTDSLERAFLEEQQGRQLNLSGSSKQMRLTDSGKLVRCIYYKNSAGQSLCSPSIPAGGPYRAAGSANHAFFPVLFLEPVDDPTRFRSSNAAAIMYDLSSNTARNISISKAIRSNSPSATSRLLLVQEVETQYGLIVFSPVYQYLPCGGVKETSQTCKTLVGLTDAVFRITDLVIKSQNGLTSLDVKIRGDQFLLDLGNLRHPSGYTGVELFFPSMNCDQLANYSLLFGIDELYSSMNMSASAPIVQARLSVILPAICKVAQLDTEIQEVLNSSDEVKSFHGFDTEGAFYVNSFMVADRRWVFIAHTDRFSYRDLLSTNAPPIILVVGILLASLMMTGSLLFRRLQNQIAHNAFLSMFRSAVAGEKASSHHLPLLLRKDYDPQEILVKNTNEILIAAARKTSKESVAIKLVVSDSGHFTFSQTNQLKREAILLRAFTDRACQHAIHFAGIGAFQIQDSGVCWFVMEPMHGITMDRVIKEYASGLINDQECMKLARHTLVALNLMHSEGVIHRNINPVTIIRIKASKSDRNWDANSYNYKLIDFSSAVGVDSSLAPEGMMATLDEMKECTGSLPYRSPEMLRAPETATYPTDIWSLGVTMFELVTGKLPFDSGKGPELSALIMDETRRAPNILDYLDSEKRSAFDHNFAKVIDRALEKPLPLRFKSADEINNTIYSCLIHRGEARYSVFLSYRVASEAPLAQILFDELNHTITPGGHRVTIYVDSQRLVKGQNWEDGFVEGLLNSLCAFPLMSFGSTAPLAELPEESMQHLIASGWPDRPLGRRRLLGRELDEEDNVLKEWLIITNLLERKMEIEHRNLAKDSKEGGILQSAYPILIGRFFPRGHEKYPRMGDFFQVQGGGGKYNHSPSPASNRAAARCLQEKAHLPEEYVKRTESRSIASVVQSLTALQGCQLWKCPLNLQDIELSEDQRKLIGGGYAGPPVDLDGTQLTEEQRHLCEGGLDERQLRMLKALVRHRLPDFHEIIDRAVASFDAGSSESRPSEQQRHGSDESLKETAIVIETGQPATNLLAMPSDGAQADAALTYLRR